MRASTLSLLAVALSSSTFGLVAGCASTPEPAWSAPPISTFSAPSSSSEGIASYAVQPSSPHQVRVDADLIVRPDRACLPVSVTSFDVDVDQAIARARATVDDITARSGGSVRIDDIRTDTIEAPDADGNDVVVHHRVVVSATVEKDLGDGDAFARSAVVAHLVDSLRPLAPATMGKRNKLAAATATSKVPPLLVALGTVEPGLKDVEQHRQQLLDGWATRVTAMSKSIGGDEIDLASCQAPPAVQVRGGTFERFGVSLPISCAIAVKARG